MECHGYIIVLKCTQHSIIEIEYYMGQIMKDDGSWKTNCEWEGQKTVELACA